MGCRAAASLALGLVAAFAGVGEVAAADSSNARTLAAAIERRAEATSFASLDAFGEAAARMKGREALRRLHHVAVIYLNQSEFDRFEHFNGLLSAKSVADGDARYRDVARIDELKSRYDRGEASAGADIARIAGVEPDWFARVHAMSMEAYLLSQQRQQGAALKLLF